MKHTTEKKQFNVWLLGSRVEMAKKLTDATGLNNGELVEAALSALVPTKDEIVRARRRVLIETAKRMKLSFNDAGCQLAQAA